MRFVILTQKELRGRKVAKLPRERVEVGYEERQYVKILFSDINNRV